MERMLKVYDGEAKQVAKIPETRLIARYPAFLMVGASEAAKAALSAAWLIEDVTDQFQVQSGDQTIETAIPRTGAAGETLAHPAYKDEQEPPSGPHHYIVQFVGPIKKKWLADVRQAGADLTEPYEGFAVVALLSPPALAKVSKLSSVRWVGHLPYEARMSEHVRRQTDHDLSVKPGPIEPSGRFIDDAYTLQFFYGEQAEHARQPIRDLGFDIVEFTPGSKAMVVRFIGEGAGLRQDRLRKLARIHGVRNLSARPVRRLTSDRASQVMGAEKSLNAPPGLGLSGDGEVIGICDSGLDSGDPKNIHPDFMGRIKVLKSYPIASSYDSYVDNPGHDDGAADVNIGHGTHTAGAIVGDGTASAKLQDLSGRVRGLAYRAKLVFQAIEQGLEWKDQKWLDQYGKYVFAGLPLELRTLFDFAYSQGARIHSNSWAGGDTAGYDNDCQIVDQFIWDKPNFCILFSAGNDGTDADNDGVVDLGSVGTPGTAKNCITVGACENARPDVTLTYGERWTDKFKVDPIKSDRVADNASDIAAFSGRGPTTDGRIKPDIVAPGTYILSARSRALPDDIINYGLPKGSNLYMYMCGTSMATPLAAGGVGIVREYLRKVRKIKSPTAALLKAAVIAGAEPVGKNPTPPDNNQGFGRLNIDNVLAPPAPLNTAFIEGSGMNTGDLNERVITVKESGQNLRFVMAYSDFPGPKLVNNLNMVVRDPAGVPHIGNVNANGGFDANNNVELIVIPQAPAGDYRLQVIGANVPRGPQRYALVVIGAIGPAV
jgi:serine protease AprX